MTARHLTYVIIAGAAVIMATSFYYSAGAQIDYATAIGVDPRLARGLPICIEAVIVVCGAAMAIHRMDPKLNPSWLARCGFLGAVVVTFAVNWAHGGPNPYAAALSTAPAAALPLTLELALGEWLRLREQPKTKPRARAPRKPRGAGVRSPAGSAAAVAAAMGAGGDAKLSMAGVREKYPTVGVLDGDIAAVGSERELARKLNTHAKYLRRRREELQEVAA